MYKKLDQAALDAILECGVDEFARCGFQPASVANVARAAGVSVGVIYKYFGDKQSLFLACVRHSLELLDATLREAVPEGADAETSIRALVPALIAAAAGMFFNLRLETGKAQMLRAVLEGICFHLRWMLEVQEKKTKTSEPIRFVGGGALSPVTCQMLADITGRTIETVENTKDVGAIGAAMLAAVGSGAFTSLSDAAKLVAVNGTYRPDPSTKAVYDRNFRVFRKLYAANKENFAILNRLEG